MLQGVENCVLDAIVSRETTDNYFFHALLVKLRGEISMVKRRVAVYVTFTF